jgi:hypothetical protein
MGLMAALTALDIVPRAHDRLEECQAARTLPGGVGTAAEVSSLALDHIPQSMNTGGACQR